MRSVSVLVGSTLVVAVGCASAPSTVSVSSPKVFGDDQTLRYLNTRLRELVTHDLDPAHDLPQVVTGVAQESTRRSRLRVNLIEPSAGGLADRRRPFRRRGVGAPLPFMGLSAVERFRRRVELGRLRGAHELLYQGDRGLTRPQARALLVRFEVSFKQHVDLGDERKFALVQFRVRGKRGPLKGARVYLLSPELSALVQQESLLDVMVRESAGELLGTAGGVGISAGLSSRDALRRRFVSLLETPLQFAIYQGASTDGAEFSVAFGPRRRLEHRSVFDPRRWFGSEYGLRYEIQPGPRSCQALLVFDRPPRDGVIVSVHHGDALLGEHELEAPRSQLPQRAAHEVAFGKPRASLTSQLDLVPSLGSDLLLVSDEVVFTPQSTVFVGPLAVPQTAVRVLGRGRLEVRVPSSGALESLRQRKVRVVQGRVVTPDQPPALFPVRLLPRATGSH